ncbi:PREDICTED: uncharacterized protein LOC107071368 [Polistes dominula]|uniref:Uncharacterized protein LOC107071368 n=1 Tax=Polistes dominula TaxID=743375 RepID=A0ABM1J022_POLDO|nr:PREDICTED: uncharacterized protein LOC107071368 [Polistes dominula]
MNIIKNSGIKNDKIKNSDVNLISEDYAKKLELKGAYLHALALLMDDNLVTQESPALITPSMIKMGKVIHRLIVTMSKAKQVKSKNGQISNDESDKEKENMLRVIKRKDSLSVTVYPEISICNIPKKSAVNKIKKKNPLNKVEDKNSLNKVARLNSKVKEKITYLNTELQTEIVFIEISENNSFDEVEEKNSNSEATINVANKEWKKRKKDQGDKNEEEEKDDDGNEKEISNNINCIGPQTICGSTKKNALFLKKCKSIGIQVQSDLMIPKFSSSIASKEELSTLTGIPTFEVLNLLEELVVTVGPKHKTSSRFDLREMILMTFMMLKQNLSYAVLAIFFKCSKDICKDIIFDMINNLNLCLKPVIYWPTKYNILKNMPKCFRGFENVRVVIDCTEVRIQKPSKLCCQLQTYSNYKSTYTVKFMTGMTPAGLISFVSKPYGGRISDNMIFEQSNLLKKMDKKDALLANRGLTVDNLCKEYDVTFISPIFLGDKTQFSKTESLLNHNVAKAFVHIERCKQQLKCFNILNDKMPMCLLSKVEEIFNVICGLVNLSAPILKNDEFFS